MSNNSTEKPDFESMLGDGLDLIDRELAESGIALTNRPLSAARKFGASLPINIIASCDPNGSTATRICAPKGLPRSYERLQSVGKIGKLAPQRQTFVIDRECTGGCRSWW